MLDLATEKADFPGDAETVGQELADLRKIIVEQPLVTALLVDPAIGQEERHRLLDRVFQNRVSPLLMKFLHVLAEKGRLNLLASIAGAYAHLLDQRQGKVEVDVTVAQRLDAPALEAVRQRVSAALRRDAVLHQYVDPSIIGGLILRVQDRMIDGSVRAQLADMRRRLIESHPT